MTTRFDVQISMDAVRGRLHALQDLAFLRPALDGVAYDLGALAARTFKDQRDPWGQPWKPLRPSTLRARRKGKGGGTAKILRDTGVLSNSISARRTGPLTVEIGTTTPYAGIHQFGGSIQFAARSLRVRLRRVKNANGKTVSRFAKDSHKRAVEQWGTNSTGWTVRIPPRPFLPVRGGAVALPGTWSDAIQRRIADAVAKELG